MPASRFVPGPSAIGYIATVGSYTGNGVDNRNIALADSTLANPVFVLVKGGANIAVARSTTMGGDFSKVLTGATGFQTDRIQNLNAAGFQVGTNAQVNANGTVYYYLALVIAYESLADGASNTFLFFTYTGNGVDSRSITGVGFQPNIVIVMSESNHKAVWKTSDMAGDTSQFFDAAIAANAIQALETDGFQVGTDTSVNNNTTVYHALCIKTVPDRDFVKTFTGNGADDRTVTDANTVLIPACVLVKADSTQPGCIRFSTETGDASFLLDATAEAANQIQAFSAGGYQVGTHAAVNANTVAIYSAVILSTAAGGPTMSTTVVLPDMTAVVAVDRAN